MTQSSSWGRALWRDLPLWYLPCQIVSLPYLLIKVCDPPRFDLVLPVLAPLAWFAVMLIPLARRGLSSRGAATPAFRLLALILVLVAVPYALHPLVTDPGTIKFLFEIAFLPAILLLGSHCLFTRGKEDFIAIYIIGMLYGVFLENVGIWMGFFEENGYYFTIPGLPAPAATMLGWTLSFYLAVWIAERVAPRSSWMTKTVIATTLILSVDLLLDPVATLFGWWQWPESFSHRLFGVPLINFIAWISAVVPFYGAYFLARSSSVSPLRSAPMIRLKRLVISMPAVVAGAMLIVLSLTWFLLGGDSPEMNLFRATIDRGLSLVGI